MALAKRIAAVSVAAADLEQIKQVLEKIRGQLPRPWMWTNEAEAEVLLIDVDSVYGHMDWLRARNSGRTVVSLTQRAAADDELVLTRPVTPEGLLAALNRVDDGKRPDSAAASPEPTPAPVMHAPNPARAEVVPTSVPPPLPAPPPPAAASPPAPAAVAIAPPPAPAAEPPAAVSEPARPAFANEMTLIEFLNPEALPKVSRLALGENPAITVDVASDCYFGPATLKPLLPYCKGTIKRNAWEPVSTAVLQGLRAAGGNQPLSRLVWLYTLANSNEQLLPGFDLNARYKLVKWPQIEREYPKHFRVATIMMKGPASLTEIADQSGAALVDVIDFVNAYSVIGFVEPEAAPNATPAEPVTTGSLLARLRARARRT